MNKNNSLHLLLFLAVLFILYFATDYINFCLIFSLNYYSHEYVCVCAIAIRTAFSSSRSTHTDRCVIRIASFGTDFTKKTTKFTYFIFIFCFMKFIFLFNFFVFSPISYRFAWNFFRSEVWISS